MPIDPHFSSLLTAAYQYFDSQSSVTTPHSMAPKSAPSVKQERAPIKPRPLAGKKKDTPATSSHASAAASAKSKKGAAPVKSEPAAPARKGKTSKAKQDPDEEKEQLLDKSDDLMGDAYDILDSMYEMWLDPSLKRPNQKALVATMNEAHAKIVRLLIF